MKTSRPGNLISAIPLQRAELLPIPRILVNELMKALRILPVEFPFDAFYQDRPATDA